MKKILITGKNSYIGNSFEQWLKNNDKNIEVTKISVRDDSWQKMDFSIFDSVVHTAGIAHIKETKENRELYFKVNRDLTIKLSNKAKQDGVKHFVFLSSMSVYGIDTGVITSSTIPAPKSAYGQSKYEAELHLQEIKDDTFTVAILRPPMVYGPGCKGNYQLLSKFAKMSPIFPDFNNKRSMIFIDNLSSYITLLICDSKSGVFLPQNYDYVNVTDMVVKISNVHNKKIYTTKMLNRLIKVVLPKKIFSKIFDDLYYSPIDKDDYNNFEQTIRRTEYLKGDGNES